MMQRMIFERIETRIVVGVVMFLGIMLLVGWVAINEYPRMAAFDRQYLGRSIERGAALFASRCATCHGNDGRGQAERAPALNNPHLFGFDYFAEINKQTASLQAEQAALEQERIDLANELVRPETTQARKDEISARIAEITARLDANNAEGIPAALAALEEQRLALTDQMQTAIDAGYNPEQPSRTLQLGWTATLRDFIYSTVTAGRPVSVAYWPQAMPAWGQSAGGELRADQIDDLTNYILNWDKGADWTIEDLLAVNQFARVPGAEAAGAVEGAVGTDVAAIMAQLATVTGDAARGDALYHGTERTQGGRRLACASCHAAGLVGPATQGTWTRTETERLTLAEFAGYTGEQYLVESIVDPARYLVPGFTGVMPANFGDLLTIQDVADLVAFLKTQQ